METTDESPFNKGKQGQGEEGEGMMEAEEEDEDGGLPLKDDPVVREIPVYLSTELAQQL